MSVLSTRVIKVVPTSQTNGVQLAAAASWGNSGSWVQAIASAADDLALIGLTVMADASDQDLEIDIGVGSAGNERSIATVRWYLSNPSNGGPGHFELPIAVSGIASGDRVAVKARSQGGGNYQVWLHYVEDPDSENVTTAHLKSAPAAANMVSVTPSGTSWANSSWVELIDNLEEPSAVVGFTFAPPVNDHNLDFEVDVGVGAASSEVAVTTMQATAFHTASGTGNYRSHIVLPFVYLVNVGNRISVRMRKSGTTTNAWKYGLLYYGDLIARRQGRSFAQWR